MMNDPDLLHQQNFSYTENLYISYDVIGYDK